MSDFPPLTYQTLTKQNLTPYKTTEQVLLNKPTFELNCIYQEHNDNCIERLIIYDLTKFLQHYPPECFVLLDNYVPLTNRSNKPINGPLCPKCLKLLLLQEYGVQKYKSKKHNILTDLYDMIFK